MVPPASSQSLLDVNFSSLADLDGDEVLSPPAFSSPRVGGSRAWRAEQPASDVAIPERDWENRTLYSRGFGVQMGSCLPSPLGARPSSLPLPQGEALRGENASCRTPLERLRLTQEGGSFFRENFLEV